MNRRLVLIVIVMLMIGALTLHPSASAASGNITFMVSGDAEEKAAYATIVQEFEKVHPDIKVDLLHIPSDGDYSKRFASDLAAGTPADVVLINYRTYSRFAEIGALEPVDPYLEKSTLIKPDDFYSEVFNAFNYRGTQYCIAQNISSLVVYYNKNLFDKASIPYPKNDWTWADFVRTAQALTDGKGQYGLGTSLQFIRFAPFIWANGGEIVDDPVNPTRLTLDTPEAREAMQWFIDLQTKYKVAPDITEEQGQDSESRFLNGTLGMFMQSRRVVPTMRSIKDFDWDVAPLPAGKQPATILHSDAYCIPAASKNKDAAWALVEFANSPQGQPIIARTGRTVPSLKSMADSPAFLTPGEKPANSKVWIDVIPSIRTAPVLPYWVDVEESASAQLQAAFYGQITLDEALKVIADETTRFFVRK